MYQIIDEAIDRLFSNIQAISRDDSSWTTEILLLEVSKYIRFITVNHIKVVAKLTVSSPGFHPAGQTSPCSSVNWKAWTRRRVSSTDLPTGKSFMVICRRTPLLSMMNKPLCNEKKHMSLNKLYKGLVHKHT